MTRHAIKLILVLIVLGTGLARAQESEDDRKTRALALLKEGRSKFDLGKFEEAEKLFEQSYEVWPYPEALYNLGQCWRKLGDPVKAIHFYKAYLRNKPNAANRTEVEARIAEMEKLVDEQKQSAEKPPQGTQEPGVTMQPTDVRRDDKKLDLTHTLPPVEATHVEPWYRDRWGWLIGGAGLVGVGVGVGFLVDASLIEDDANSADQFHAPALYAKADDRRTTGTVLAVVGGAALAVGVIKLVVHDHDKAPSSGPTTDVAFGLGWVGIQGSF